LYGAWEPKRIVNLETGVATDFPPGVGHTGFILQYYYADAFELRPDSKMALYYVVSGRPCKDRVDGEWYLENDTLVFPRNQNRLRLVALSDTEMVVLDTVNFAPSQATYRKRR